MIGRYRDRAEAGRVLASALKAQIGGADALVLGLPRGGVPVAFEVARALDLPLDLFLVRKLGVPGYRELAMGAIASGGVRVLNEDVLHAYGVSEGELEEATRAETAELLRRERTYRGDRPPLDLEGRSAILVDDGLATGATMKAAVQAVRGLGPDLVIVAVPVAPEEACAELQELADAVICPLRPEMFSAIGLWYDDFEQTSDEEVRAFMRLASADRIRRHPGTPAGSGRSHRPPA